MYQAKPPKFSMAFNPFLPYSTFVPFTLVDDTKNKYKDHPLTSSKNNKRVGIMW